MSKKRPVLARTVARHIMRERQEGPTTFRLLSTSYCRSSGVMRTSGSDRSCWTASVRVGVHGTLRHAYIIHNAEPAALLAIETAAIPSPMAKLMQRSAIPIDLFTKRGMRGTQNSLNLAWSCRE